MTDKALRRKLRRLARTHNITDFRPGQEDTMVYVLKGEDTLAIMPTGAGKSLCYQLPAELLPGMTIVVSPLISLMKDQYHKIIDMGLASQHLSSELTRKQTELAIRRLGEGKMDVQFVTPEKLENPDVLAAFRKAGVSLFVVDEAHCISEWGHDFRPAYLTLSKAVEALGRPTILALTATATTEVTGDIQMRLGFREPRHVVRISYRRDNLMLRAREFPNETEKLAALMRTVARLQVAENKSGIIYCASVNQTEALYQKLRAVMGVKVAKYHGRMKKTERRRAQERFMSRPGRVMVATSAFGMGIDKPDVRFVINCQIPNSIESYYQEVGRAGRDGKAAYGIVFYTPKDRSLQRVLALRKYPNLDLVRRAVEAIFGAASGAAGAATQAVELDQAVLEPAVGKKKLSMILKMLEKAGFVELHGRRVRPVTRPNDGQLELVVLNLEERKSDDRHRLDDMVRYVHTGLCRWHYLLKYFGENLSEPCGQCDSCQRRARQAAAAAAPTIVRPVLAAVAGAGAGAGAVAEPPLGKGNYVVHSTWGVGEVVQRVGPNLKVFFPGIGEKMLREAFVQPWHGYEPKRAA